MKAKLTTEWNFYCTTIPEGTEVTIIKGMEADAADVLNAPYGMCYLCEYEGSSHYVPATYLTITDWSNIDWEQRRYEIAKDIMAANHANPDIMQFLTTKEDFPFAALARVSVKAADALVEELQKKQP